VTHAAPLFRYLVPENAERRGRKASGDGAADDPATDTDYEWSLRKANVLEAWKLFGARPPGEGVQVGHPDTGYTLHPELAEPARLLVAAGYDYDDDDDDPLDGSTGYLAKERARRQGRGNEPARRATEADDLWSFCEPS